MATHGLALKPGQQNAPAGLSHTGRGSPTLMPLSQRGQVMDQSSHTASHEHHQARNETDVQFEIEAHRAFTETSDSPQPLIPRGRRAADALLGR